MLLFVQGIFSDNLKAIKPHKLFKSTKRGFYEH